MAPIRPRSSRRGRRRSWVLPVSIIIIIAIVAVYGYYMFFRILNNQDYKADRVYFMIMNTTADGSYYMLRTDSNGKAMNVEFPLYSTIDGKNDTIDPDNFESSRVTVNNWLDLSDNVDFHWQMSDDLVTSLSDSLGIEADEFDEFIDKLASRGVKILDYWKFGSYVKQIKGEDPESNITSAGFAAFLKRLSDSQITRFEVETLTEYPVLVYDNETDAPEKRLYIDQDSIEKLKTSME